MEAHSTSQLPADPAFLPSVVNLRTLEVHHQMSQETMDVLRVITRLPRDNLEDHLQLDKATPFHLRRSGRARLRTLSHLQISSRRREVAYSHSEHLNHKHHLERTPFLHQPLLEIPHLPLAQLRRHPLRLLSASDLHPLRINRPTTHSILVGSRLSLRVEARSSVSIHQRHKRSLQARPFNLDKALHNRQVLA